MSKSASGMEIISICILAVAMTALSVVWSGYVLSILWGWFIVSLFSCPPLAIPQAIGLSIVVRYLTWQHTTKPDERPWQEQFTYAALLALISPTIALLVGWAVHFWVGQEAPF